MELTPGTVVGDRYRIEGQLGEGGMAVVYQVTHTQLGTQHALKVLTLNSRSIRDRMLQEGRFQAKLQHPNIVAVTDVVAIHESPALVMELVDGPPLDELLRMQKLTIEQADAIGRGILSGVAHAHAVGLIHQDLKPANIMLQVIDQSAIPKVMDFGLAKLLVGQEGRAATRTGSTMGTPQYMSPEQIKDSKNVDERADVFALAAILYELICGQRAFDGDNVLEIFQSVDRGTYVDPRSLRPDAPERMFIAIEAGLRGDREERVSSAAELYALWTDGEALSGPPTLAPNLGTLPSLSEFRSSTPNIPPESPPLPAPNAVTPMLMLGGSVALIGAGVVILVLLAVVGLLWSRPTPTRIVQVPGPVIEIHDHAVPEPAPLPGAVPTEVPAIALREEPPTEPVEEGVPWEELVGPDGELRASPLPSESPAVDGNIPSGEAPGEDAPALGTTAGEALADALLAATTPGEKLVAVASLQQHWRAGSDPIPESKVLPVLSAVGPISRMELLRAYGMRGRSLQPPAHYMALGGRLSAQATRVLVKVAKRQGTEAEALRILDEHADSLPARALKSARQALKD